MRLHRFYTPHDLEKGQSITISDEKLIHQMRSVFRFQSGDTVILFNGNGSDYVSEIVSIGKSLIRLSVTQAVVNDWKPAVKLILAVSMIKKDNFEWIVQKATELGVSEIIPLISERSEKKGWNRERAEKILIEACEQSGRSDIPVLGELSTLSDFVEVEKRSIVVFHTDGMRLNLIPQKAESIVALVGPEGGWSEKEIELFCTKGYAIYKLSTPILRAETAAIAIASIILAK
jgi:16S rRNA (uracil1498-N3)-methyltransferase